MIELPDMQRFRSLPLANATPCHPLAAYYCDDCGEPDWTDATAGGDIRKFYSDDDRGDTICEVCMRKRVTTDDKRGVVAAKDGGDGAPEASPVTTPGGAPSRSEPGASHPSSEPLEGSPGWRRFPPHQKPNNGLTLAGRKDRHDKNR
jgi:hypothetical protein